MYLCSLSLIHGDIKLQNIMLVNAESCPYTIKLIDFGCAHHVSDMSEGAQIQTLNYRSPEIHLGLPYSESVDIWSLGCVIAELFMGRKLYPGWCSFDMMLYISEMQDLLPQSLLDAAPKAELFFKKEIRYKTRTREWRLKRLDELPVDISRKSREIRKPNSPRLKILADIIKHNVRQYDDAAEFSLDTADRQAFLDLLQRMLAVKAARRITAFDAVNHPFISLEHLCRFSDLEGYQQCTEAMKVCCIPDDVYSKFRAPTDNGEHSETDDDDTTDDDTD